MEPRLFHFYGAKLRQNESIGNHMYNPYTDELDYVVLNELSDGLLNYIFLKFICLLSRLWYS